MFKPLFGTRVFFEADGTGWAPAVADAPVVPATAPVDPAPPPAPKDPNAATRYQISRAKDETSRIRAEFDEYKAKAATPARKFTSEEDPTGEKEIKNIARQEALDAAKQLLKDSWFEEKFSAFQYESAQKEFFNVVESKFNDFKKLWIEPPSRWEMIETLKTIDDLGITPEELIAITRYDQIVSRLKPGWFSPWDGGKNVTERPLSREELFNKIYSEHNA